MSTNNQLTYYQDQALKIIALHDKSNPITGLAITKQLNLKERDSGKEGADIRAIINALRCKGYPICAQSGGYYYARLNKELSEFVTSFQGRINKQQEALEGMQGGFNKLGLSFSEPDSSANYPEALRTSTGVVEGIGTVLHKEKKWKIDSETTYGRKYTVYDLGYRFICDCPSFNYKMTCKHIKQIKEKLASETRERQGKLLDIPTQRTN